MYRLWSIVEFGQFPKKYAKLVLSIEYLPNPKFWFYTVIEYFKVDRTSFAQFEMYKIYLNKRLNVGTSNCK